MQPRTARRLVTGHDAHGKSVIVSDGQPPATGRRPGVEFFELWSTQSDPALIRAVEAEEPTRRPLTLGPGGHGSVVRFVDFWPPEPGVTPFMHRTETVDYGIVLEGEIHLILDDTATLVRAGEIVIQRGTDHAWENRSRSVCRMVFVLLAGSFDPELRATLANARPGMKLVP